MPGMGFGLGFGFHRRASGSGAAAHETLKTLVTAADSDASVYDPDNDDTATLRSDGSDLWYSAIADGLGNREDLVQATAANQTKQITLSNGRRARLAALGKHLVGDFSAAISQPNTVLVVGRPQNVADTGRFMDTQSVTGGRQIIGFLTSGWAIWAGTAFVEAGTPDTNWHIEQGNYNGASSELFLDEASIATGDAGANALGGVQDDAVTSGRADLEVGPIIVFSSLKTLAELSDIYDHLNANWPIGSAG